MPNIGNAQEATATKLVMLVRDQDGNVKFFDWHNIPEEFHPQLSEKDWQYIKEQREKT